MSSTEIRSYMIYNPAYRRIRKYIKRNGYRNYIVNTWNVCLDTRKLVFDMKLIWVKGDDPNFIKFMDDMIEMSNNFDFSYNSQSLSVQVSHLRFLKEFINTNKLWHLIEKIQTVSRLSQFTVNEKVITFHRKILSTNVLASFEKSKSLDERKRSIVVAKAYGWLTPLGLNHFKKKILYRYTHVVIYLLLDYYRKWRRRRNIRVLNLFDLCSLRLAMFDPRYYQFDQCELPDLIHSELCLIVECGKELNPKYQFDPILYFMEQCIEFVSPTVAEYFESYVSDYCNDLSIFSYNSTSGSFVVYVHEYMRLYGDELYEDFLIDFIRNRPFLELSVVSHLQAITPNLLGKMLDLQNVAGMSINVDFPVVEFEPCIVADSLQIDKPIALTFVGKNENNYLANYIAWLKTFTSTRQISLKIICKVADFTVFNSLNVSEIEFRQIEINSKDIFELSQIEQTISTQYKWKRVTLAKNVDVLKMIHGFPMVQKLDIIQDENTFETIFKFIEDIFQTYNCTELEFGSDSITFNITVSGLVFNLYKFGLNSEKNKIEMYDKKSENVVDLYDVMFHVEDSMESYDFYQ